MYGLFYPDMDILLFLTSIIRILSVSIQLDTTDMGTIYKLYESYSIRYGEIAQERYR